MNSPYRPSSPAAQSCWDARCRRGNRAGSRRCLLQHRDPTRPHVPTQAPRSCPPRPPPRSRTAVPVGAPGLRTSQAAASGRQLAVDQWRAGQDEFAGRQRDRDGGRRSARTPGRRARRKISASGGAVSHSSSVPSNSASAPAQFERAAEERQRRVGVARAAFRRSAPPTPPASATRCRQLVENPNGGASPDHGIGTRHLSRPRSVCPERSHVGSCSTSSGNSTVGQTQFLAVVDEHRARQGEHHHRHGPRPAQPDLAAAVAGDLPAHVVVGQRPGRGGVFDRGGRQRVLDRVVDLGRRRSRSGSAGN